MNCLIILLLLTCGGCQNRCGCGCGNTRNDNICCRDGRDREDGCSCRGEERSSERCPRMSERDECDCRQGGPAAWSEGREGREGRHNSYPSISSDESCGCDTE